MLLVKTTNGQVEQFPYTLGDLRRDNPQTSFPKKIGDAILASYGIYHVMPDPQPEHDPLVQTVVRDAEPHEAADRWVIGFTVANKPQDQAEQAVRNQRDQLLAETDWMALSDVNMSAEMQSYRQEIRDKTEEQG